MSPKGTPNKAPRNNRYTINDPPKRKSFQGFKSWLLGLGALAGFALLVNTVIGNNGNDTAQSPVSTSAMTAVSAAHEASPPVVATNVPPRPKAVAIEPVMPVKSNPPSPPPERYEAAPSPPTPPPQVSPVVVTEPHPEPPTRAARPLPPPPPVVEPKPPVVALPPPSKEIVPPPVTRPNLESVPKLRAAYPLPPNPIIRNAPPAPPKETLVDNCECEEEQVASCRLGRSDEVERLWRLAHKALDSRIKEANANPSPYTCDNDCESVFPAPLSKKEKQWLKNRGFRIHRGPEIREVYSSCGLLSETGVGDIRGCTTEEYYLWFWRTPIGERIRIVPKSVRKLFWAQFKAAKATLICRTAAHDSLDANISFDELNSICEEAQSYIGPRGLPAD